MYNHTGSEHCPACESMDDLGEAITELINQHHDLSSADRLETVIRVAACGFASTVIPGHAVEGMAALANALIDRAGKALIGLGREDEMMIRQPPVRGGSRRIGYRPDESGENDLSLALMQPANKIPC